MSASASGESGCELSAVWPAGAGEAWVFGYGSLMWDPGFAFVEDAAATLRGWRRSLCVLSIRNRGTVERPGLALGLARGGACRGRAFRVAPADVAAVGAALWEREMANRAYIPRAAPVRLADGRRVAALVFVADRRHPQWAGNLSEEEAAALVATGRGAYGAALDYLRNVVRHLDADGVAPGRLHRILARAEAHTAAGGRGGDHIPAQ